MLGGNELQHLPNVLDTLGADVLRSVSETAVCPSRHFEDGCVTETSTYRTFAGYVVSSIMETPHEYIWYCVNVSK